MVSVTALLVWLLVAAVPATVQAGSAQMELDMAQGIVAEADYWPGAADRPAILILHGFLQTREFPTVRRLAESLAEEGFSVLAPTLTLGLNRRRQSLACEAIHTHSMQQDVAELLAWTGWLAERTGKSPVLIGHSSGGVQLAAMLDSKRDLAVDQVVMISLTYFGEEQGSERSRTLMARAGDDLIRDREAISAYPLVFCDDYVTTAANYLSYLGWGRARLEQALISAPTPVTVVYGDKDRRIDSDWLDALRLGGVTVRPVPGANHFFDLAHEFDLFDEVAQLIAGGNHG